MKLLLVEDEKPAVDRLLKMIREINSEIKIAGKCKSIKETVAWLKENDSPDLMLLDIQLSDGSSLEIFQQIEINFPVIFATAYDQHILESFNYNAIDYLLKPIKKEKLASALARYKTLKSHFSKDMYNVLEELNRDRKNSKSRYLVKSGSSYQSIATEEISFFYSDQKITFIVNSSGSKFILDAPLKQVEEEVDPNKFFRLNRQYLANINSIKKFKSANGGKLLVELIPEVKEKVVVSQEKAAEFKKWLSK